MKKASYFLYFLSTISSIIASDRQEILDNSKSLSKQIHYNLSDIKPLKLTEDILIHILEHGKYSEENVDWSLEYTSSSESELIKFARENVFSTKGEINYFRTFLSLDRSYNISDYVLKPEIGGYMIDPENPERYLPVGREFYISFRSKYNFQNENSFRLQSQTSSNITSDSISSLNNNSRSLASTNQIPSMNISTSTNSGSEKETIFQNDRKTIHFKSLKLADNYFNNNHKDFYKFYSEEKKLWVGLEFLNPESLSWWKRRLAYDVYMLFGKYEEFEEGAMIRGERSWNSLYSNPFSDGDLPSKSSAPSIPLFTRLKGWMNHKGETTPEFERLRLQYSRQDPLNQDSYIAAWKGFDYNLENPENLTWVSYVSTQDINGPLYKELDVTSPHIKMAMTVQIGEKFYSPLGIYRSPIAQFYDQDNNTPIKNISLFFHSATAGLVGETNPNKVDFMVVRPLEHMKKLLETSNIPFSISTGDVPTRTDLPHIRYKGYYQKNENLDFMNQPFALISSDTHEAYLIGNNHWFSKSQFLGSVSTSGLSTDYPYMTTKREQLAAQIQNK